MWRGELNVHPHPFSSVPQFLRFNHQSKPFKNILYLGNEFKCILRCSYKLAVLIWGERHQNRHYPLLSIYFTVYPGEPSQRIWAMFQRVFNMLPASLPTSQESINMILSGRRNDWEEDFVHARRPKSIVGVHGWLQKPTKANSESVEGDYQRFSVVRSASWDPILADKARESRSDL